MFPYNLHKCILPVLYITQTFTKYTMSKQIVHINLEQNEPYKL